MMSRIANTGATLAALGTVHAAINSRLIRRPRIGDAAPGSVSVLIPARNEAATIGACLDSLRGQDVAEILVLDDESSDATAQIVASSADTRVRVISGTPPPPGWLGKAHACQSLVAAAQHELLVFLDADVRVRPGAIAATAAMLGVFDLVSPQPRELAESAAERLVQPLLQWSIRTFLPVRLAERSGRPSLAAANGQFIAVRRASYRRAGGHASDAVLDDIALARAIRRAGGRTAVVDGSTIAECRMYSGWAALRDGHSKSLWSAFGALRGSRAGLFGYAAAVAGRALCAQRTGERAWPDSLAHPVSITVLGGLTARSHYLHSRGALSWRGRPLPTGPARSG
jgi:hypothetical protein